MSYIAVYQDWKKNRQNLRPKAIRKVNGYGFLAKPKPGSVIVIENVTWSGHVTAGAATRIANLALCVCDASGNCATISRTGVNTGTSATVCTVSGGGMTPSAFIGQLLRYTSGTNIGKIRLITANDATTITTDTFTTAPANLDTFEIVNQGTMVPIMPTWRIRRDAALRISGGAFHPNLEIVLGESAGIGYMSLQGAPGAVTYIEPTEFSLAVQARYEPVGYRSNSPNFQIQPSGGIDT
jgi:hypothetical protein